MAFESFTDGRRYHEIWSVEVLQNANGAWHFCGGGGGAGDDGLTRDHPWVSLGGGGWPEQFHAGGRVIDKGLDIACVRLITGNGVTMEDTVDDGFVLFVTDQRVEPPIHVELYDRSGVLVSRHAVFSDE